MISCAHREVVSTNLPVVFEGADRVGEIHQVNYFEEAARHMGFIYSSSVALRRDVVQAVGGFSLKKAGEDIEYWVKVALQFPVAVSSRVTCLYFRDTGGVMQQLADAAKDRPEPPPSPLREFSAGVSLLLARVDDNPALLQRPDIRRYINAMLIVGVRGCLYQGHLRNARHYARFFLRPLNPKTLAYRLLTELPVTVLQFVRNAAMHRKMKQTSSVRSA